jgi:hypothetical protein
MVTEEEVRRRLAGERARAIEAGLMGAQVRWQNRQEILTPRTRANVLSDYMVDGALAEFANMPGIALQKKDSSTMFVIDDVLLMKFKKHDSKSLSTRNYPTHRQQFLSSTGYFEGMPNYELVTCGYVFDAAEASFEKLVIARHIGDSLEWWIDLRELADGNVAPVSRIIPGLPDEYVSLPRISRKSKEAEKSE